LKRAGLFLFLWLLVGFSLGSGTLLGPVRWVANLCRARGAGATVEQAAVVGIILLLLGVTAAVAAALAGTTLSTERFEVRAGVPILTLVAAAGALWLWMTPSLLHGETGAETTAGLHFTFGPYPDEARLAELKREGYTAVVSLLHPAVIPFEPRLLAQEKEAAARVGIELIQLPMLPWVSANSAALDRVRTLARAGTGRYYVHCYLGRDRVMLVKRIVEQTGPAQTEALTAVKELVDKERFERGAVVQLNGRIQVVPFPTDEEFLGRLVGGGVTRVVSLLQFKDPDDRIWLDKERLLLAQAQVPLLNLPLDKTPFDPYAVLEAARRVRTLPGEIAVHDFLAADSGRAPVAEAFVQAFRSGRPPLPPSLFADPLAGGSAAVLAPHVAAGPRPLPEEFAGYLKPRGVRVVVRIGENASDAARADRGAAIAAGLTWRNLPRDDDAGLTRVIGDGGPFYLYGDLSASARAAITAAFGPAVPDAVRADAEERFAALPGGADPSPASAGAPPAASGTSGRFLRRAVPDAFTIILLGPPLLLFAAFAAGASGRLRVRHGLLVAYTRKGFHFAIFTMAGLLQFAGGLPVVMLFGGIVSLVVLYAVARGDGFPFYEALARPADAPRRTLFIMVPLLTTAMGGLLANVFFGAAAITGYMVGGWGDAVGEPVGTAFGRHRYRVPSFGGVRATRSFEGSAAVFLAGSTAATLGLLAQGVLPARALGVGFLCGLAGALVEAFSTHGMDNLTVQLAAAGTAFLFLR
jgi:phytol kinase